MSYHHEPVMLSEVILQLELKKGGKYIDCTLGGAGYSLEIAQQIGKEGSLMSIDLDPEAIKNANSLIADRNLNNIVLKNSNFNKIKELAQGHWGEEVRVDGVVMDLGLSSFHLSDRDRGFSFQSDKSIDMSFGPKIENSTLEIVNYYNQVDLEKIFREYGDESRAHYLARAIVEARKKDPIVSAKQLADIISLASPAKFRGRLHPATKIFQALRMETNQELDNLQSVLPQATELLKSGAIIAVVSFHSGEDRIVKRFFRDSPDLEIINKKPLVASSEEIIKNPRARSAKLRVAKKI